MVKNSANHKFVKNQSIPSPKVEPFKIWLAKVGYERIEEAEDPEKTFDRAKKTYEII